MADWPDDLRRNSTEFWGRQPTRLIFAHRTFAAAALLKQLALQLNNLKAKTL